MMTCPAPRSFLVLTLGLFLGLLLLVGGCESKPPSSESESKSESEELGPPPLRFPHLSIRMEKYLLPAVSTGPLSPTWSPDGEWIAFLMRGDLWKVRADGGTAVALTNGPGYYFEPAWSPDGETIAFSVDREGQFDLGLVSADGDSVRRIMTDEHVDVEPTWGPKGMNLYFVSDREGRGRPGHLRHRSLDEGRPVGRSGGGQSNAAGRLPRRAVACVRVAR